MIEKLKQEYDECLKEIDEINKRLIPLILRKNLAYEKICVEKLNKQLKEGDNFYVKQVGASKINNVISIDNPVDVDINKFSTPREAESYEYWFIVTINTPKGQEKIKTKLRRIIPDIL